MKTTGTHVKSNFFPGLLTESKPGLLTETSNMNNSSVHYDLSYCQTF